MASVRSRELPDPQGAARPPAGRRERRAADGRGQVFYGRWHRGDHGLGPASAGAGSEAQVGESRPEALVTGCPCRVRTVELVRSAPTVRPHSSGVRDAGVEETVRVDTRSMRMA